MKKQISMLVVAACLGLLITQLQAQAQDTAYLVRGTMKVPLASGSGSLESRSDYHILYTFAIAPDDDEKVDLGNWRVTSDNRVLPVVGILGGANPRLVAIRGDFVGKEKLVVRFKDRPQVVVDSIHSAFQITFGGGQGLEAAIARIAQQKSILAFDYNVRIKGLECFLSSAPAWIRLPSVSLDLTSTGTLGSEVSVRNGTQSVIQISANPFLYVGGLIYESRAWLGGLLETMMDTSEASLFNVTNKQFVVGLQLEVPFSNYPMFRLHEKTGYLRLAMPLTVAGEYHFRGRDGSDGVTPARFDMSAVYELAFSPYLILRGEWASTVFDQPPSDLDKWTHYYSVSIAQDLDVLKSTFGILKLILGEDEQAQGKSFWFYRVSVGSRAPGFQDLKEQSFGFAVFF